MALIDMSEIFQMTNAGDHIDGTDVYQSNRNLLDNAYFVGGGSQLGDGIFPINQRGQAQYTGGGTQLDRWHGWAGTDTLVLTANGLQYTSPSSNGIFQYFPVFPTTQTVTFSVKVNGTIKSITLAEGTIHAEEDFSGYKLTVDRNDKCVGIFSLNETILLQAAKLEVGTVSTLANDVPPDFGEELRKCQRYLYVVGGAPYTMFGSGIAESGSYIMATVQFPVPMRATPVLSTSGAFRMWGGVGHEFNVSGISISSYIQIPTNCPYAGIMCSTSGSLTIGNIYYLQSNSDTNAKLIFSAEL